MNPKLRITKNCVAVVGVTRLELLLPLMLAVAYFTFAERKLIGYMQARIGPNRVGPRGWLQPIADAVKLMFKEIVIPTNSNQYLFRLAPLLALVPALAAIVPPLLGGLALAATAGSFLIDTVWLWRHRRVIL